MAIIKPFKGYLPPSNIAYKVSSPPYDVLSTEEAREMVNNNPDSFLKIIKPEINYRYDKKYAKDSLHKQAVKNLNYFISSGKLQEDDDICFYIYQITMGHHVQTGIMAAVSIEEYNQKKIKIHEFTRSEKENDRTHHIQITNANTGPVFLTFKNNGHFQKLMSISKNLSPDISFETDEHIIHQLWKITSIDIQHSLIEYFQSIPYLYIADGHHRAAAASKVQKIRQDVNPNHNGNESYNFFLSVIFPHDEMQILSYNRVVKDLNGLTEEQYLRSIEINFNISQIPSPQIPNHNNMLAMYLGGLWYQLEVKKRIQSNEPVEKLGASILQNHLLNPILGIADPRTNNRIDFIGGIRGLKELEYRCNSDSAVAFVLHPVSIDDLLAVADSGQVMPPKSTWFEPKLRSGLVVRLLN